MNKKYNVVLTEQDKRELLSVIKTSKSARTIARANVLLALDANAQPKLLQKDIVKQFHISACTAVAIARDFITYGLDYVLTYKRNPNSSVSRKKVTGEIEAALIQIACGEAPDGRSRWTVDLITEKLIQMNLIDEIHPETVRLTLKKMNLDLI